MDKSLDELKTILEKAKQSVVDTNQESLKLPSKIDKILQKYGIRKDKLKKEAIKH